jgi:hypothetical protein
MARSVKELRWDVERRVKKVGGEIALKKDSTPVFTVSAEKIWGRRKKKISNFKFEI